MGDPFDLDRFVRAQRPIWDEAMTELDAGRKRGNWVPIVFPTLAGFGNGVLARRFSLRSLDEADAYAAHATLHQHLEAAATRVAAIDLPPRRAFGWGDARHLHASMTLFAGLHDGPPACKAVIEHLFAGLGEPRTVNMLARRTGTDSKA